MPPTAADAASADAPSTGGPAECLAAIATASPFAAYRLLGSSPRGLVEADADARLAELGENVLAEPVVTASARLVAALHSPFIALLAALAGVFALVDDLRGSITVTTMVLLAVVLRYWQQTRSESAVRALRPRAPDTVTVRRRARDDAGPMERELPWTDLVPGDLLLLAPGDVVPADVRVVAAADLRVDQAVITGESLPVPKRAAPDDATRGAPRPEESPALCLAGCAVVAGTATALVVATGPRTYSGALANPARRREESSFDRGVRSVSLLLVRAAGVPISTVSFGTEYGTVDIDGRAVDVPVADADMHEIADRSGGQFFRAASDLDLRSVYDTLATQIGQETVTVDDTHPWVLAATALLACAVTSAFALGQRLP